MGFGGFSKHAVTRSTTAGSLVGNGKTSVHGIVVKLRCVALVKDWKRWAHVFAISHVGILFIEVSCNVERPNG